MRIVFYYYILCLFLASCAPKGDGILNNNVSTVDQFTEIYKSAPFAYDIAADTISYNSCPNYQKEALGSDGIPGFSIGVNEGFVDTTSNGALKGGLKLRTEFLLYIGKNFKPEYPALTISPAQIQRVLLQSDVNKNAYLQFGIRAKSNLGLLVDLINPTQAADSIPVVNRDAKVILADLSSGYAAQLLTKEVLYTSTGQVLSEGSRQTNLTTANLPSSLMGQFQFNATADRTRPAPTPDTTTTNKELPFGAAEFFPEKVRRGFNDNINKYVLTAVFGGKISDVIGGATATEPTISMLKRPPVVGSGSADLSKAYGRSYALQFISKAPTVSGWAKNIVSSVTEYDLSTGAQVTGASWACENFVIAHQDHYNNKRPNQPNCAPLMGSDLPKTSARLNQIKKIRRQYPETDWNIGLFIPANYSLKATSADRRAKDRPQLSLCLSPKSKSCYLPTTGIMDADATRPELQNQDIGINYDLTKECYLTSYQNHGFSYSGLTTENDKRLLGRCAQFASICVRSSSNF